MGQSQCASSSPAAAADPAVLKHLDLLSHLRVSGPQRRGYCPVHSHPGDQDRTVSVHLGKSAFRCFQKNWGLQGNALDLWAAVHRLPLFDAALHLAETFGVPRNREEEPVKGTTPRAGAPATHRQAADARLP
jgi:hypothetical protein